MKIYIGFSKPKNHKFPIFSWLIRLFERTRYSHVYIRWYDEKSDSSICFEASGRSVKFICKEVFEERINPIHEFEITIDENDYFNLQHFAFNNSGKDYGVKQVFGILLVRLFGLRKNPFASGQKSWVCSELAGTVLSKVLDVDTGLDLDIAGPKDIFKFIKNLDCAERITMIL